MPESAHWVIINCPPCADKCNKNDDEDKITSEKYQQHNNVERFALGRNCMKKKLIGIVSLLALVVICATCFVACNTYKWKSIGGGDPSAPVESNGGYAVKQGKYVYYLNGYEGTDAANEWGKPVKQSIVRSEIKDGVIDLKTTRIVVPKSIYNASANGGFSIFGEWIYYATPNYDRDKNGNASTTDTDFMRTKIDGSVTQLIGRINVRNAEYLFTPKRILYYTSNTISYIDFSKMKTNSNIKNGKGATEGVLAQNVSSVVWKDGWDEIFYTQTVTGDNSYKNYNELCSIKIDGSDKRILATENTYLGEGEEASKNPQKVFKFNLRDMCIEGDEDNKSATIYYTKTYSKAGSDETVGLFCAKGADFKTSEKKLNTVGSTTIFALGYDDGALAQIDSKYYWCNGDNMDDLVQVTEKSEQVIWKVDAQQGIAYYTDSSGASFVKISYKEPGTAETVFAEKIKVDWLKLDFIGDDLYFFAADDSNFMHVVNIKEFKKDEKDAKTTYIGFEREEDEEEEDK